MANPRLPLLPLILDTVPPGLRQALAQEGIPVADRRRGPPEARFLLFDSQGRPTDPPGAGQVPIDVDVLRKSGPGDPFVRLTDQRAAGHRWPIGSLELTERVARVDKRAVRRRVLDELRKLIEMAGGIWLRLSAFPFPYRTAFHFRIDYDEYDPGDFRRTLETIAGHEHATSHFVCGSTYEPAPEALARLRGLDVGSHGYWHHTYRTTEENLRNVARGIEVLRAAMIEPSGFCAPHGKFCRELLEALDALGVSHASEFGLAYDELPFFVPGSRLLEIPVHPVCLGLFLEAARTLASTGKRGPSPDEAAGAAIEYFQDLLKARYRAGEPAFLYGHPTGRLGRYPQVLKAVLETVGSFGAVWKTTMTRFADWWRLREQVRLTVVRSGESYLAKAARIPFDYRVGIEYCRGEHVALLPLSDRVISFSPESLVYEKRSARPSAHHVRIDRPEGLRGTVRQLIDWERVTPVEEIAPRGWRNWTKRTLRRIWSP